MGAFIHVDKEVTTPMLREMVLNFKVTGHVSPASCFDALWPSISTLSFSTRGLTVGSGILLPMPFARLRHPVMLVNFTGVALGTSLPSAANLSTIWASLPQTAGSKHLHLCRTYRQQFHAEQIFNFRLHTTALCAFATKPMHGRGEQIQSSHINPWIIQVLEVWT